MTDLESFGALCFLCIKLLLRESEEDLGIVSVLTRTCYSHKQVKHLVVKSHYRHQF